jgi:hypothetical protein
MAGVLFSFELGTLAIIKAFFVIKAVLGRVVVIVDMEW